MKKLFVILSILMVASCSPKSPEAVKKQIAGYKNQIAKLNRKIAELEEKLKADTSVTIDDQKTLVVLRELAYQDFAHYITLSGKVNPEQEAFISPEINGQVRRIHVKEGQSVKRGEPLLSLRTDITESSIQEVQTSLDLATMLYEKQKELWDQKVGSEVQYLQTKSNMESLQARLATLGEQLQMASVTAPFAGIVEEIFIKEGELASPGVRLLHLVNLGRLKITADVSENYLNDIQKGEMVTIEFPSLPEMTKTLAVKRLGSVIDSKSRTFTVEVGYENPGNKIKPNQFVQMMIKDFASDKALVVPSIIIRQDIQGHFLFIAEEGAEGMKAKKVYITPGKSYLEETMVLEGILPGQKVIVTGYNLVRNGSDITI